MVRFQRGYCWLLNHPTSQPSTDWKRAPGHGTGGGTYTRRTVAAGPLLVEALSVARQSPKPWNTPMKRHRPQGFVANVSDAGRASQSAGLRAGKVRRVGTEAQRILALPGW